MNTKRLRIYLNDHLALMVGEADLAGRCQSSNQGTPLGDYLEKLKSEIKAQQSIVRDMLCRVGGSESSLKQGAMWLAEKVGRLKRNDTLLKYSRLSRLLELEALAAAAQERLALWDNLQAAGQGDGRLTGISFDHFLEQSRGHLQHLDDLRRDAAREAFAIADDSQD